MSREALRRVFRLTVASAALVFSGASCGGGGPGERRDTGAATDALAVETVGPVADGTTSELAAADLSAVVSDGGAGGDAGASGDGADRTDTPADAAAAPPPWADLTAVGPPLRSLLGVSTHMNQRAGEDARRDFEFAIYEELGGVRIREDYHWHRIEPADDEWHFEAVSTQAEMANGRGVEVLAMLAYGVDWAMADGETSSIDPADFADFAGAAAPARRTRSRSGCPRGRSPSSATRWTARSSSAGRLRRSSWSWLPTSST